MVSRIQYEVPTWNQIQDMLLNQAQKVHSSKPDFIVGISRGGLIPARILADLLGTPQLTIIQVEFYVNIEQPSLEPKLKQPLTVSTKNMKVLLVDDIADTGRSLQLAKTHLQQQEPAEIKTATLYVKPHSQTVPDFYEKKTSSWVVFPWDTKETLRKIAERQLGIRALNQEIAKLVKAGLPKQLADRLLKDIE